MAEVNEEAAQGPVKSSPPSPNAPSSNNSYADGGVVVRESTNDDRDPYSSSMAAPNARMAELLASRASSRRSTSTRNSESGRASKREEAEEERAKRERSNPKVDPAKEKTSWNVVFICAPYAPDSSPTRFLPEVISVAPTVVIYDQQEVEIDHVLPLVRDVDAIMPWLSAIEWPPASSKLSDILHQYLPPGCGITQSAVTLALCGKDRCDISGTVQGYVNISFGDYHYFIPRHLLRSELATYPYRRITANPSSASSSSSHADSNGGRRSVSSSRHDRGSANSMRQQHHKQLGSSSRANGNNDDAIGGTPRTASSNERRASHTPHDKHHYRRAPLASNNSRRSSSRNEEGDSFFDDGHDIGSDFIKDDALAEPDLDEPAHHVSRSSHSSKKSHAAHDHYRKSGYHH